MSIPEIVKARDICEILHFTTNKGVLGILDTRALKARARLNVDARLEYIFQPNAANRTKDEKYLDYVNLSISRINSGFFSISAGSWHKHTDLWWCVLSFTPEILEHDGVIFTTTNNIYTGVKRMAGAVGLEAAYEKNVTQWNDKIITRPHDLPDNMTTCEQAEVLYPGELSTRYLRNIYVRNEEIADELAGQIGAVSHDAVEIKVNAEIFRNLG